MTGMNGKFTVASAFAHLNPQEVLAEGITSGFSRIGMKGKVWSLIHQGVTYRFIRPDDGTPLPYLDVVFVGVNPVTSKLYYPAGSYSEDTAGNPPTCSSLGGVVPDPGVPIPQSQTCALCQHNQWLPNRGGKQCQDHRRTAVLLLPYMKTRPALEAPMTDPVFLKIPPASLRPSFKNYSDGLAHRGIHWATVITRITFDPTRQFQMNFELKQPLTNAEAPLVLPLLDSQHTRSLTGVGQNVARIAQRPAAPEPQETGLAQAFGAAATNVTAINEPKRGRPRKSVEAPQPQPAPPQPAQAPVQQAAAGNAAVPGTAPTWDEDDSDLEASVADAMNKNIIDMLK